MTRTYDVTLYGVIEQLTSKFKDKIQIEKDSKNNSLKNITYNVPSIYEGQTITLNLAEVSKIANIIYKSIFNKYPGLNLIYNYFLPPGGWIY